MQEEYPWQLPCSVSVSAWLGAGWKCKEEEFTFPVLAISAILMDFLTLTVMVVLGITIPVGFVVSRSTTNLRLRGGIPIIRAAGTVTVTSIIVAVPAIVLARRVVTATAATWGRRTATSARGATTTWSTLTITAGVEAPRCRWRCSGPLFSLEWNARNHYGGHQPRSSRDHLYQCVCCASHGRRHLHHDGSHTQRMQTCW